MREMLKTGVELRLVDEMTPEEKAFTAQVLASSARQAQLASEDDLENQLLVPLFSFVEGQSTPFIASMMLSAIALITDSIAAGGEINGYGLYKVTLRGSRGCALSFRKPHVCSIL